MTEILSSIDLTQQHVAKFRTLKNTNIYIAYSLNTTINKLITEFFNNYSVKNYENKQFDIHSSQLNKSLLGFQQDTSLSDLNLDEISEFVIKIKPEFINEDSETNTCEHKELLDARQKFKHYKENMNDKKFLQEEREKRNKFISEQPKSIKDLITNEIIPYSENVDMEYKTIIFNDNNFVDDYIFNLFIVDLHGKTHVLYLYDRQNDISCEYIMVYVEDKLNIPVQNQRLMYAGKQLQFGLTCKNYNISDNSSLYLVLRLKGGMYDETSGKAGNYEQLKTCLIIIK